MAIDEQLLELLSRWEDGQEQGQTPTPEELCRDRPELLPQLMRHIYALQKLKPIGSSTGVRSLYRAVQQEVGEARVPVPDGSLSAGFTRYHELRLHAQGGLGEVHVAWDGELRREVALKRIRKHRAGDIASRRRFRREAEITALLEHPGVVPVYGLMEDTDGHPCYAMRLVQGETLQDAIERFHAADQPSRDPGERSLALRQLLTRFVTVCNTIACAHSRDIIHRDLKPGNIMLGPYGETLVVDWGLAKPFRQEETSPTSNTDEVRPGFLENQVATETGQMMGTPGYMSPEQAAGRWDDVGPTSDIYSLGATLHAIVTGHAPFGGPGELDRIRGGEFPAPQRQKKKIPPALAAVCLRALASQPQDRYASALHLAADVEHWLGDEPLEAYPEPWPERLQRWGRRHRPVVAATAALLLTAIVALAIGTLLIRQREQAAQTAREQAESQRLRANANLKLAREAVDKTVTKITADPRLRRADFHKLRHDLLEYMVPLYEELVGQRENDPELRSERGRAYHQLARLRAEIGESHQALSDYEQMRALFAQLVADCPMVPDYRFRLAISDNNRGNLLKNLGKNDMAEAVYRDALEVLEQLTTDFPNVPDYRLQLAGSHHNLANLLKDLGKYNAAEATYLRALGILERLAADFPMVPDYRHNLAKSHSNFATLLRDLGKHDAAETAHRDALKIRKQLVADFPKIPDARQDLADSHDNLGILLKDLGKLAAAEAAHRDALRIREQLAVDFPRVPEHRQWLAASHHNLGELLRDLGRLQEAEAASSAALRIFEQLAEEFPRAPEYLQQLAGHYNSVGGLMNDLGKREAAEAAHRRALKIQKQLAADFPKISIYRHEVATSLHNLGTLLRDLGKPQEAEAVNGDAVNIFKQLAAEFPKIPAYRQHLAHSYHYLGTLLFDLGKRAAAEVAIREAFSIWKQLASDFPDVPDYRGNLAASHNDLGNLLRDLGKPQEAEAAYRNALSILQQLATDFPTATAYRQYLASSYNNLSILLLVDLGERNAAEAACRSALTIREQLAADFSKIPRFQQDLAGSHYVLGNLLTDLGKPGAAQAAYHNALRIYEQLVADSPSLPDCQNGLASTLLKLSRLAVDKKEFAQARQLLERATPHHQAALTLNPQHRRYRQVFRNNRAALVGVLTRLGEHAAAAAIAEKIAHLSLEPATDCYVAASALSRCVPLVEQNAEPGVAEQARAYSDRALELLRQAIANGYTDVDKVKTDKDLEPLRGRREFQPILADLETKMQPKSP